MLGPRITLAVDNLRKTQNMDTGKDFQLGNFTINSFVYLGGLPPWYSSKLSSLALPSVVFEPRFRGEVRNVIYADSEDGAIRQQGMMAFKVNIATFQNIDMKLCQSDTILINIFGAEILEKPAFQDENIFQNGKN